MAIEPITTSQVFDHLRTGTPAGRGGLPADEVVMATIIDAVEGLWRDRWSVLIALPDGTMPDTRPAYVTLALTIQAGKLWDDRKLPGGGQAGNGEFGPFRLNRFHPDVETLLNDESWGVA